MLPIFYRYLNTNIGLVLNKISKLCDINVKSNLEKQEVQASNHRRNTNRSDASFCLENRHDHRERKPESGVDFATMPAGAAVRAPARSESAAAAAGHSASSPDYAPCTESQSFGVAMPAAYSCTAFAALTADLP